MKRLSIVVRHHGNRETKCKMKPTCGVGLCNKLPIMDKSMQLIGIVLLYLADLSGSEDILGKKCAWLLLTDYDNELPDCPEELYRQVKIKAAVEGIPLKDPVKKALREYLKR